MKGNELIYGNNKVAHKHMLNKRIQTQKNT